ncbi:DUF3231 family protein [Cytobacillus oceanisediminis]|uniref:DUF3231 family protein n=1 Tax=Niallia alba TaxID=2729105 RepID=A0A7Y0PKY1_9BACI|nr:MULTISPECIES: DUF3231 family protein [Bacillaceae]MBZ9536805.1 DUF3231 family protein [Cytobacillus oceanisediminis]NMO75721.1 DUF3231 family protein [Niallia alba]PGT81556.1 hypothetical protein COD11_17150 [Bacillus sp. AFS040349]UTI43518.1 DUF3231 family protein [Niallia sp. RD1]
MQFNENNIRLTSAEMSQLWGAYINDSLAVCVLKYFLEKVEDKEIRPILEQTFELSESHLEKLTSIFTVENFPIPQGFTDEDININAPRLYSDTYFLKYVYQMSQLGLNAYSIALPTVTRADILAYFSECLTEFIELHKMTTNLLLSKGLYIRPPYIPTPKEVDFVKSKSFLAGWLGERRPLLALEISNLFNNIQRNALGVATLLGFSQVANSKEVRQYMVHGKEIASKHVEIFGSILREEDLPVPMTWDSEVTDSTVSPFSDKLMMFQTTALNGIGMGYYGASIATSPRHDLATHYARLSFEIGKYSEEGTKIMFENGWFEQPPQAIDRDELAKRKS